MIREQTDGGKEIVDRVLRIARGQDTEITTERSRCWALGWCADRLWGRPALSVELTAATGAPEIALDLSALTPAERAELERLTAKAQERTLRNMPTAELEQHAIDAAIAGGESEQEARTTLAEQNRKLRSMSSDELRRIAAGEDTSITDGDADEPA